VPDSDPTYATESYVDAEVSNLVDSAPGTLDTLNELASALGDDPDFATTVSTTIGTKLPLAGGTMSGGIDMGSNDITNVGDVDGRDLSADGTKLDGIEDAATADQTASEIRALVDSATDSNVFTNADQTKLNNIESGATADQSDAEIKTAYENNADTNAFTDADHSKLDGIESAADVTDTDNVVASLTAGSNITIAADGTISSTDTNDNTQLTDEEVQDVVGSMVTGGTETGISVTYDDTAGKLDFAVESQTDENFTTADHSKLDGVEDGADVTPSWVPSSDPSYATETYVDTEVSNLVDSAPGTLDTLNELAAALGDDPNFATTVTTSIGTKLPLSGGTMTGDIVMTGLGTVDGRDLSVDGTKLDGIESGATGDQDASEIRTLVGSATDSNVFTDADHTKLDGIESGADVTDTANVTSAGALMDSEVTNLAQVKAFDSSDYAAALGADSNYVTDDEKVILSNTSGTNTGDQDLSSYQVQPSEGAFADGDKTKLDGIESGATADQTGAEIKSAYEGEADTNAFTDDDHTKLDGIESGADVTDTDNVVSALTAGTNITIAGDGTITATTTPSLLSSEEEVEDIVGGMVESNTESGISVTYDDTSGKLDFAVDSQTDENFTTADHTKLDGIESGATADQTGAEIKSAYEGEADTNAFTDVDHTKLDGIESGADVTDTDNVVSALTAGTNITIAGDGTITATTPSLSSEEVEDIVGVIVPSPAMVILVPAVSAATTLAVSVTSAESSMPSNLV
jgi:hypothetical protein